jgi:hypothetical protein
LWSWPRPQPSFFRRTIGVLRLLIDELETRVLPSPGNRPFFHGASPNRGPIRRRLLKISILRNQFLGAHLNNARFQVMIKSIPAGNPEINLLGTLSGK